MKRIIIISATFLIITILVIAYHFFIAQKTAFVNLNKVYDEFTYKKEMEEKFENIKKARQSILDSLKIKIEVLSRKIEDNAKKDNNDNITKM